jgi:hypothetical protein
VVNGTSYTFTIVPLNSRGDGPATTANASPGGPPAVTNVAASMAGDRRAEVTFSVDTGGRPITGCTIESSGGQSANCNADSGSGQIDLPTYDTAYTFTVRVTNELGENSGTSGSARTAGKPLVVDAEVLRWDGACWPDSRDGQRPYYPAAAHNSCNTTVNGWVNDGVTVRGLCQRTGEEISDDYGNLSNRWVQIDRGGFMSTLYFRNFENTNAVIDGLRAC